MPGATVFPGDLDNFAEASPTNLGDNDTTGRTHAERHDDIEAAVEALQARVVTTVGTFAEASPTFLGTDDTSGRTHSERHNDIATAVLALQSAVGFTAGTFATTSPTNLADNDSSGRTHSERHDDIETAVEALQTFIGVTPTAEVPVMLAGAALYLDAEYHEGSETVFNRGTAGYALNALNGGGTAITSNDAKFLAYSATDGAYVYLPGVAGNYLSVPDAAALDITGDIDLRVKVALDDWTPASVQMLLGKENESSQRSYWLVLNADGTLSLYWSSTGSYSASEYANSAASTGITDGAVKWVRATLDVNNGAAGRDIKFWLSDDGVSWTQLGSTVTQAGTTSVFASTTALTVGSWSSGSGFNAAGKFYRAIVKSGIDGTTVLDVDTSVITSGAATSFTATTGQTVTINRSTSGRKSVAVTAPCWLLGTDDYMAVADNALLDFDADDSFTVLAFVREWGTPASYGRIIGKQGGSGGYQLVNNATALQVYADLRDGTNTLTAYGSSFSAGSINLLGFKVDRAAQRAYGITNSTIGSGTNITTLGDMTNAIALDVGRISVGGYQDFELTAVAVFRSALTAAQISAISTYFTSR